MASNRASEKSMSTPVQPPALSKPTDKASIKAASQQTTPQINSASTYRMARSMQRLHRNVLGVVGAFDPSTADDVGDDYNDSDIDDSDDDDNYSDRDSDNDNDSIRSAHSDDETIRSDDEDQNRDPSNSTTHGDRSQYGAADTGYNQNASAGLDHHTSAGRPAQIPMALGRAALGASTTPPAAKAAQTNPPKPGASAAVQTSSTKPATPAATLKAATSTTTKGSATKSSTSPTASRTTSISPKQAKDAQAPATTSPSISAVTPQPTAEKSIDSSVAKPAVDKQKQPVAPPGYEIVRVKKPDGTIVRVKRPIKPTQKSEEPKPQADEAQTKPITHAAQPKAQESTRKELPEKISNESKVGTTVSESEKVDKTEAPKSQHTRAQKYARHTSMATRIIIWTIMIALPLLFIILGILTAVVNGYPVASSLGQGVTQANRVAVSIWPIAFAALAAQALRMYASYKVERGLRLMTLEQLISSHSVASAIKQPFLLQRINWTSLLLLCLWSLSPLAGQALLRMSYTGNDGGVHNITLQYIDTTMESEAFAGASSSETHTPIVDALFAASILAPPAGQVAPMDTWGNTKIPIIQDLNATDETGWAVLNGQPSFSSLVGVPVSGLLDDGSDSSFIINSAYFNFDCPDLTNVTSEALDTTVNQTTGMLNWTSPGGTLRMGVTPLISGLEGAVLFASKYVDDNSQIGWQSTLCKMSQEFVQSHISCTGKDCSVDQMHVNATNPSYVSPYVASDFLNWMAAFTASGASTHSASYLPLQFFLNDTTSAGRSNVLIGPNLLAVAPSVFKTRLALLLNTYWQAGVSPIDLSGAIQTSQQSGPTTLTAIALNTSTAQVYRTSWGWLTLLLFSSVLLLLGGIVGAICDSRTVGPDIFGFASNLANKNKYMRVPTGDSSMSGPERTRMLGNVKVMLQDVRPNDGVGRIALGSVDNGGARLMPGRVYK